MKDGQLEFNDIEVFQMDHDVPTKLSEFMKYAILIVNIASNCQLAKKSYERMKELVEAYEGKIKILLFPCSQFLDQEFKENSEIRNYAEKYSKSFVMMEKVQVKGDGIHPLFELLTNEKKALFGVKRVLWNFTSFLVCKGTVIKRYLPGSIPEVNDKELLSALKSLE